MSQSSKRTVKRKAISLEEKIQILDRLASGEGATAVGRHFSLNEATVRTIKKNETAIRKSLCAGTSASAKMSSYSRDVVKEKMEKALIMWMEDKSQKRIPVDGNAIKQTALKMYSQIKEATSSDSEKKYEFSASTGWMTGFLKRHGYHNIKIKGETASADENAAKQFPQKLKRIIEQGGYLPDQVWNADETGLFWKRMPSRTYVAKAQKTAGGFKVAKDRVTLLFCSNASGDRLLKPLLVNRALRPRSMKGVNFNELPVHWMANRKAWVTTVIFSQWFNKYFVPEVRRYLNDKGIEFKVLLIVDNAPGHPDIEHPNVQLCFLPPNTTSLIQPLDQGIIATFKTYYVKKTFQHVLDKIDNGSLTVPEVWKEFSIMDCINLIRKAISDMKPSTLNACWKTIWPECIKNNSNLSDVEANEFTSIITLATAIGGEGFDDMCPSDINEILADEALSEHDLIEVAIETIDHDDSSDTSEEDPPITADLIKEGLQLARKLGNHFVYNDPDVKRASSFQRDLNSLLLPYKELYRSLDKTPAQRLMTEFVTLPQTSVSQEDSPHHQKDTSRNSSDTELILSSYKELYRSPPKTSAQRLMTEFAQPSLTSVSQNVSFDNLEDSSNDSSYNELLSVKRLRL